MNILRFCIFLCILLSINSYFIEAPIILNILAFLFVTFTYYIHDKFILYCQDEVKLFQNENSTKMTCNYYKFTKPCIYFPILENIRTYSIDTPFLAACRLGDTQLVQIFLNKGVDIFITNRLGEGAIYLATYDLIVNPFKKDVSCIRILYKAGCPLNVKNNQGFTALHLAAAYGRCTLIKWLLEKGADYKITPLACGIALARGHFKAALILLHNIEK